MNSYDKTIDGAIANLKETVELYLEEGGASSAYHSVGNALIGEMLVNA